MEKTSLDAIKTTIDTLQENRARLVTMPDQGAVLYFEGGLALNFTDDDPSKPYVCGLAFARIFTEAERGLGDGNRPHAILQRTYQNGRNETAFLRTFEWARREAIENIDKTLATLGAMTIAG